jgi:diguanylate cyclase (GGDEF)-like protein
MALQFDVYIVLLFCGAAFSILVAAAAWRRPVAAGGRQLAALMLAVFVWSLAAALEAAAVEFPAKIFWSKVEYLGIAPSPLLLFFFAVRYSRSDAWLTPVRRALLWAVPVSALVLAVTNEWHHLIWASFSTAAAAGIHLVVYHHGPFFWIHVAYAYSLLALTSILIVRTYLRSRDLRRRQALALLLALPWPWLGNLGYITGITSAAGHDFTALGFAVAGLFLLWGMFRLRLADLLPVAREKVIESMGESLIVLDEAGRVGAMNPSAEELLASIGGPDNPSPASKIIGTPASVVFSTWPELASRLSRPSAGRTELVWEEGPAPRYFNLHLTALAGRDGIVTGWVAMLYDVTRLKQAENEAVRARNVAEALQEAGLALSSTLDHREMSTMILQLIQRVIFFDAGAFLVADGAELRLAGVQGLAESENLIGHAYPVEGRQLCNLVAQHRRPLVTESIRKEDVLIPLPERFDIHSYLGVPIVFQGHVTGLLALYSREASHFKAGDIRVAELFANQAAIALQNARLFQQMSTAAVTDTLTGLSNRRHFFGQAEKEFERARRYGRPLSLIMLDIDNFKAVNDSHGHLIGDQVLRVLAAAVGKTIRATDYICRFGGDEFLILMPESDRTQALAMAERLRQKISTEMVVVTARGSLTLTISLGVASLKDEGETLEKLVGRADAAMYEAKAAGRDKVCG